MQRLANKNIILGVTGGIAAYKSADLIRRLREAGATVRVIMTQSAKAFITSLTMQALSGHPVYENLVNEQAEAAMGHIELARWADLILIAPATADFIARFVQGRADDLLCACCLASSAKLAIAPAMNQQMWHNEATQTNLQILAERGIAQLGPEEGMQACGDFGPGRMLETNALVEACADLFSHHALTGLRILITAGPTHEAIDPIRFLSNSSTGKMGYALAEAAVAAGAKDVHLISGPSHLAYSEKINCSKVTSASQMHDVVMKNLNNYDIFIACAAVSDYRCATIEKQKIKKTSDTLELKLIKNPDILLDIAKLETRPMTIGFAAESTDLIEQAKQKLTTKKLDMIIANPVDNFAQNEGEAILFSAKQHYTFPKMRKTQLARELIEMIARHYLASRHSLTRSANDRDL